MPAEDPCDGSSLYGKSRESNRFCFVKENGLTQSAGQTQSPRIKLRDINAAATTRLTMNCFPNDQDTTVEARVALTARNLTPQTQNR
jgi:hypothetical protein